MKRRLVALSLLAISTTVVISYASRTRHEEKFFRSLLMSRFGEVVKARVDEVDGPYSIQAGIAGGEGVCYPATKYIGEGEFLVEGEFGTSVLPFAFVVLNKTDFLGGGYSKQRPEPYEPHGCDPRATQRATNSPN
jgi:hypothetical protein